MHRVVAQLKRRLASQGHELKGRKRHAHVDVRRTMRASLQTGGVPIELKYRPRRPRRPEIFVLCDVSTSVTSASTFFLSVLHALHDSFRKLRSFVFIERISEVTEVFERERDFRAASEAVSRDAGVADISGYTDYGRVWTEFLAEIEDELHPRATVIVLGDARTNGRPPRDDVFAAITAKAGRTFWLNPEPKLYWNYGDSVIAAYARALHRVRVLAHRPARGFRQGAHPNRAGDMTSATARCCRCFAVVGRLRILIIMVLALAALAVPVARAQARRRRSSPSPITNCCATACPGCRAACRSWGSWRPTARSAASTSPPTSSSATPSSRRPSPPTPIWSASRSASSASILRGRCTRPPTSTRWPTPSRPRAGWGWR